MHIWMQYLSYTFHIKFPTTWAVFTDPLSPKRVTASVIFKKMNWGGKKEAVHTDHLSYCKIILTSNLSSIWNKKISANKKATWDRCVMLKCSQEKKIHHIYKTAAKFIIPTKISLKALTSSE